MSATASLYDSAVFVPANMPVGEYNIAVALVDQLDLAFGGHPSGFDLQAVADVDAHRRVR